MDCPPKDSGYPEVQLGSCKTMHVSFLGGRGFPETEWLHQKVDMYQAMELVPPHPLHQLRRGNEMVLLRRPRNKKLPGAPGLIARSKDATRGSWQYH